MAYQDRIIIDPAILVGKPVVKGTRVPVELVLKRLSRDLNAASLLESYPNLNEADVRACLEYAYELVAGEDVFPGVPDPAASEAPGTG